LEYPTCAVVANFYNTQTFDDWRNALCSSHEIIDSTKESNYSNFFIVQDLTNQIEVGLQNVKLAFILS